MAIPQSETVRMPLAELLPAGYNPRKMSPAAMAGLKASLEKFGELGGIVFNRRFGRLVGGHQRVKALAVCGEVHADVRVVDLDESDEKALNLTLNNPAIGGDWAADQLATLLEESQAALGDLFKDLKLDALWDFAEKQPPLGEGDGSGSKSLSERFGVPPFSVLDARQGYWQERKRAWLALGIQSELGRGGGEKLTMSG